MRAWIVYAGCLLLCAAAFAQENYTKFEVATVKPASRVQPKGAPSSGGPGTRDPGRLKFSQASLSGLLLKAFALKPYQLPGPDWLDTVGFEIVAKVPPDATKDRIPAMLRNLLVERFHLTYHHEARVMTVYELTVARDGPKFKESDLSIQRVPPEPGALPTPAGTDEKGFPIVRPGSLLGRMEGGIMRVAGSQRPIPDLVKWLENDLERPIVDKTGLVGKYDVKLEYSRDGLSPLRRNTVDDTPSGGPSLMKAVEEQLGLKLQSAKDPVDILVIDHIDKVPTDN